MNQAPSSLLTHQLHQRDLKLLPSNTLVATCYTATPVGFYWIRWLKKLFSWITRKWPQRNAIAGNPARTRLCATSISAVPTASYYLPPNSIDFSAHIWFRRRIPVNRITAIMYPSWFFADFTSARIKTYKIGCAAKRIGPVVHLLVSWSEVLGSNHGHQPEGHHMPLGWCALQGSSPVLGAAPAACFWLFFLWL